MIDKNKAITLKEWANIAIAKHTRKILKYEARVPKDKDPEDLHQMRVGIRRLRSAISGFAVALDLPPTIDRRNLAKIGRSLGRLRDLDVLIASLNNDYRPSLPEKEQKSLDKVIKSLEKQRKKELKQVRETLDSKFYLNFQQRLQKWLEKPQYRAIGDLSIYLVLPDLLLPQISQLLLHPGWLVGVTIQEGQIQFPESLSSEAVEQLLEDREPMLHDLRKEAKRTRYNLELFTQFYDDGYSQYVRKIEQIQEVLGKIQDCYVLRQVLSQVLKSKIVEKMPELSSQLTKTRYQKWQEWSRLQKQFLETKTQIELRQIVQKPIMIRVNQEKS